MCFRGILKKREKWNQEMREQVYIDLMTSVFEELFEEYSDVLIKCLETIQLRYEYTISKYPKIPCDVLDFVIRLSWVKIEDLLNNTKQVVHEPPTYKKYIMISNCTYGVINNKHPLHICW